MLKRVSLRTAALIKEKIIDEGVVKLPITNETLQAVFDWFDEEEIALANAKADTQPIDEDYFNEICIAVNDLLETSEEKVDVAYLNDLIAKV